MSVQHEHYENEETRGGRMLRGGEQERLYRRPPAMPPPPPPPEGPQPGAPDQRPPQRSEPASPQPLPGQPVEHSSTTIPSETLSHKKTRTAPSWQILPAISLEPPHLHWEVANAIVSLLMLGSMSVYGKSRSLHRFHRAPSCAVSNWRFISRISLVSTVQRYAAIPLDVNFVPQAFITLLSSRSSFLLTHTHRYQHGVAGSSSSSPASS